jgi:hypothetical protein
VIGVHSLSFQMEDLAHMCFLHNLNLKRDEVTGGWRELHNKELHDM